MQVFKLFFKLLKSHKGVILMYVAIFSAIAVVMSLNNSSKVTTGEEELKEVVLEIAFVDEDQKIVGNALKEYFGENNEIMELEYDEAAIVEKLFWRELDCVIVIPEGFEASLSDENVEDMELKCMQVPGYFDALLFESDLKLYMSKLTSLLKAGYSIDDATAQLLTLREEETEVSLAEFVNENQNDISTILFLYVPYLFMTVGMLGVGIILIRINNKEVRDHMECSALTLKQRLGGLTAGILVFGLMLMALVVALAAVLSKGEILTDNRLPYFLINIFGMLLFGLSLGFFGGTVAKSQDSINGILNVLSIGLCFLGGVFVPKEFFSDAVLRVAKFSPTYWYVVTNESIGAMKQMTPELANDMFWQIALVVGYALAIFAVTVVIIANKRKKVA